jgi:hypothetical protein
VDGRSTRRSLADVSLTSSDGSWPPCPRSRNGQHGDFESMRGPVEFASDFADYNRSFQRAQGILSVRSQVGGSGRWERWRKHGRMR